VIEDLFALKKRQAANLMQKMEGCVVGGAHVVSRETLLGFLDARCDCPHGPLHPAERKVALALALKKDRSAPLPLRATLGNDLPRDANSLLPAGIDLVDAGRLEIRFGSPGEILGAIVRLAQLADSDPAGFSRSLEYRPPESAVR
jgi:hypothetical protein